MWSNLSLQRSDIRLWLGSWAFVQLASALHLFGVLNAPFNPTALIVPNVVGLLIGACLAFIASGRRKERALRTEVERQAAEVRRLNAAQRTEDRTRQLRAREHELLQPQKMEALGRLAEGVAHDFNNLLTDIVQGSERIIEMADDTEATRERAREIHDTAHRAAKLTARLLSLGHGRREPKPLVPVDLASVVSGLQPLIVRLMGKRSIVAIELMPDTRPILADRTHLEQVVLNLCVNARDAMPDGGTLSLGVRHIHHADLADGLNHNTTHGAVHLWVHDSGCGIQADIQDQVFTPLFTTKEAGVGTGLGLSIVQRLVTRAQGTVRLTSHEGQGARFDVYWPALGPPDQIPTPPL